MVTMPLFHTMETRFSDFPRYGKIISTPWKKSHRAPPTPQKFSTLWKKLFHTVEKMDALPPPQAKIFHTMEKTFPHRGKLFSAQQPAPSPR
jgi:hypothetical protein